MGESFIKLYRRYLGYASRYPHMFVIMWIGGLTLLTVNNLSLLFIGQIIDAVNSGRDFAKYLMYLIGLLAIPIVLEPASLYFRSKIFVRLFCDFVYDAYNKVLRLDYSSHAKRQTGKQISIIMTAMDVSLLFSWRVDWFLLENLASLLIPIIFISFINIKIALTILAMLVLSSPFIYYGLKRNSRARIAAKDIGYERNTQIVDGISNYETVKIFGRENEEIKFLDKIIQRSKILQDEYQNTFRVMDIISSTSGLATFAVSAFLLMHLFNRGEISLGVMAAIMGYLLQIIIKIRNFFFNLREVNKDLSTAEDLFELIDQPIEINESPDPKSIATPQGGITFDNITFGYEANREILKDLSIEIAPKQNIALVGPSGGGKSTLVRLLLRYYDVQRGSIKIDGIDIRDLRVGDIRKMIGFVPQEPVLFNRTIMYNIGYALGVDAEDIENHKEEIYEAARKAQIHDFINSLPEGYDTYVGERGIKLSGGQKQRIAIARIILKAPKIVIFDEATSMLDSESEQAIQKAFKEMSRDKTVIIIAHRLSTIIHCNQIFLIEKGQVKEHGDHASLLERDGAYAKLWQIQSGGFSK